jgi:rubrerythrin
MEGGIDAWRGLKATGSFEAALSPAVEELAPAEILGFATALEKGSGAFYSGLGKIFSRESEAAKVFAGLVRAEEAHVRTIADAAGALGVKPEETSAGQGLMEGGVDIESALAWCREKGRRPSETLELAMQMETNSLDLYLRMLERPGLEPIGAVLEEIVGEEKAHLRSLGALMEKNL